jgi:hypothetical protein
MSPCSLSTWILSPSARFSCVVTRLPNLAGLIMCSAASMGATMRSSPFGDGEEEEGRGTVLLPFLLLMLADSTFSLLDLARAYLCVNCGIVSGLCCWGWRSRKDLDLREGERERETEREREREMVRYHAGGTITLNISTGLCIPSFPLPSLSPPPARGFPHVLPQPTLLLHPNSLLVARPPGTA